MKPHTRILCLCVAATLLFSACGGRGNSGDSDLVQRNEDFVATESPPNEDAVPTMPAARFSSVGEQSGITTTERFTGTSAVAEEQNVDLVLGERVYNNHCAECHGSAGEGGSAAGLAGLTLEFDALEDLLRTGGEVGPEHLFGTRRVSENGMVGLHGYLTSLQD